MPSDNFCSKSDIYLFVFSISIYIAALHTTKVTIIDLAFIDSLH